MKKSLLKLSTLILLLAPLTTLAKDSSEIPEYTVEGLKLIPGTETIAYVWAEEGADLSQYNHVYLVEPYVAFKKNWQRDQNRNRTSLSNKVGTNDMERMKAGVKELFIEVFTEELQSGGYTMASEKAEDVLLVRPAIIDLDVVAPDVQSASRSTSFASSAGSMTLYMELYDSVTGDLLAKAVDPTSDRDTSMMQWQTSVSNRAAAKRLMKPWAVALRKGLDKSKEATKQK